MKLNFILACLFLANSSLNAEPCGSKEFESRYVAWKTRVSGNSAYLQSTARAYVDNPEFRAIVGLGPSVIPYIVTKMESDAKSEVLWHAIRRIAKINIREKYDPSENRIVFPDFPGEGERENIYLYWWRVGRFQTETRFKKLYVQWCKFNGENRREEADKVYRQIVNLGLPVLPCLVGIVDEHSEFVAAVSELTDGAFPKNAKPEECKPWWEKNKERFTLPALSHAAEGLSQRQRAE